MWVRTVGWFGIDSVSWVYVYTFGEVVVGYIQKQDALILRVLT